MAELLQRLLETAEQLVEEEEAVEGSSAIAERVQFSVEVALPYHTVQKVFRGRIQADSGQKKRKRKGGKVQAAEEAEVSGSQRGPTTGAASTPAPASVPSGSPDVGVEFVRGGISENYRVMAEAKKLPKPSSKGTTSVTPDKLGGYDDQARTRLNSAPLNGLRRCWLISFIGFYIRPYYWESQLDNDGRIITAEDQDGMHLGKIWPSDINERTSESHVGGGPSFRDWYDLREVDTKILLQQIALDIYRGIGPAFPEIYGQSGQGAWQHTYIPASSTSADEVVRPPKVR